MKRVLVAVAALSTLAAALPAAAQPYRGDDWRGGRDPSHHLEMRIQRMVERGAISWREARNLRAQVNMVERLEWRYSRDGLSNWERRDLDRRYDAIQARIRYEARDGRGDDRYGYGYGNGGGYRR
jgi:hypothetical protein